MANEKDKTGDILSKYGKPAAKENEPVNVKGNYVYHSDFVNQFVEANESGIFAALFKDIGDKVANKITEKYGKQEAQTKEAEKQKDKGMER